MTPSPNFPSAESIAKFMVRTFVELGCKGDSAALKPCDCWVAELDS